MWAVVSGRDCALCVELEVAATVGCPVNAIAILVRVGARRDVEYRTPRCCVECVMSSVPVRATPCLCSCACANAHVCVDVRACMLLKRALVREGAVYRMGEHLCAGSQAHRERGTANGRYRNLETWLVGPAPIECFNGMRDRGVKMHAE